MTNPHTFQVRVAVLKPAGRGRMGVPRTDTATYTITTDHIVSEIAMGLASVEAIERATVEYGESGDYPYTISIKEGIHNGK